MRSRRAQRGALALGVAVVAAGGTTAAVATADRGTEAGAGRVEPIRAATAATHAALLAGLATDLDTTAQTARSERIEEGYAAVVPLRPVVARDAPHGRPLARVRPERGSGGPLILSVGARRGDWVGVRLPERPNGRLAWLRADDVRWRALRVRIDIDLSARRLSLRRDGRVVLRVPVAVGRSTNPTPVGRYGVTDHVRLEPGPTNPYGAGALPLTGHQTKLPAGWPGGDRLAIHGATDEGTIGSAVSTGCMRLRAGDLRRLLAEVPLGATVVVSA